MSAYYNENDPFAAAWLRELVAAGAIAPGDVDERSIVDIRPSDIIGYDQYHFFAGVGVWSYALRLAGWPDDRPIWTGSCPCQPFSAAGKGGGHADERHLWPAFHHLIGEHRPDIVVGEQVASKDGLAWLDLVHADLEASGYAVGASDTCAAGVGAPHIRQRLWWVGKRLEHATGDGRGERRAEPGERGVEPRRGDGGLADAESNGRQRRPDDGDEGRRQRASGSAGEAGGLADADQHRQPAGRLPVRPGRQDEGAAVEQRHGEAGGLADAGRGSLGTGTVEGGSGMVAPEQGGTAGGRIAAGGRSGPVDGFWRDADWLLCRDDRWRPVEPGTFPLAHGAAARVGRLRGYGNAVVAEAAKTFIQSLMDML